MRIPITQHPFQRSPVFLGAVTVHDVRDQRHVMGCAKCSGLPLAPDSGQYTIPFWEAYEKEQEKWR